MDLLNQRNHIAARNTRSLGSPESKRKHQLTFGQLRDGNLLFTQADDFVCFAIFPLPGAAGFKQLSAIAGGIARFIKRQSKTRVLGTFIF